MNEREQLRFILENIYPLTEESANQTEQWFHSLSWWRRQKAMKIMRKTRNFTVLDNHGTIKFK